MSARIKLDIIVALISITLTYDNIKYVTEYIINCIKINTKYKNVRSLIKPC